MNNDMFSGFGDYMLDRMYPTPSYAMPQTQQQGDVLVAMGGSGAGVGRKDINMSEAAQGLADTLAAPAKGATQGFLGTPGDILNLMGFETLPTTEQVKKWLDDNVGKVGDGAHPMEKMGEFAAPGGYVKGAKAAVRAKKATAAALGATAATSAGETKEPTGNK